MVEILEFSLRFIAEIMMEFFCYFTGRVIVPVFSLGRAYVEPAPDGVEVVVPKWHGFQRGSDGGIIIAAEMGALIGLLFWVAVAVVCYVWFRNVT